MIKLHNADCLHVMQDMINKGEKVDAIITDPPYFEIKGDFDFIWETKEDYLAWFEEFLKLSKHCLSDTGTLIFFGHWKNIAYQQIIGDKYFKLINNAIWSKTDCKAKIGFMSYRKLAPITERFLIYSKEEANRSGWENVRLDINNFKNLRNYAKKVQDFIGLSSRKINKKLGHHKAQHFFCHSSTHWGLPTQATYNELIEVFKINKMEGFRSLESLRQEYESLRQEYESLKQEYESLRRPFNPIDGVYDAITYGQDTHISGKYNHPTQKPVGLMEILIKLTTNKNQVVFDPFMGSGTTGVACNNLSRDFIGVELDKEYFKIAEDRLKL